MNYGVAPLLAALLTVPAFAQSPQLNFSNPNTRPYSVERFDYPVKSGNYQIYQGCGFFTPATGDIPTRVFMLPGVKVDIDGIQAISNKGKTVDIDDVQEGDELTSIRIPVSYTDPLPNADVGAAIMASISGKPITSLQPRPLLDPGNQPVMFQPAAMNFQMANGIRAAVQQQMTKVNEEKSYADAWAGARSERAGFESLVIEILIDGEMLVRREYPGSMIATNGKITTLAVRNPDTEMLNRLREGTFEIQCTYRFKDANVGAIHATYDFRRVMSQYIEKSRTAVTQSRSSGWKIFGIGSRRTSLKTSINESVKDDTVVDQNTNTVIELEDADDEMIARFEAEFFPTIVKERVIETHLRAAEAADVTGNRELAKAHRDYVMALQDDKRDAEIDAIGAAAALGSGNYAMFIAKGVRFHNDKDTVADNFHQIISASVTEGASKEWSSQVLRSRYRSVIRTVEPTNEEEADIWFGLLNGGNWQMQTSFGPKSYLFVSCVAEGSPLHRAGVLPGMLISDIDGEEIRVGNDLERVLGDCKPGDTVTVNVLDANNANTNAHKVILMRGPKR